MSPSILSEVLKVESMYTLALLKVYLNTSQKKWGSGVLRKMPEDLSYC